MREKSSIAKWLVATAMALSALVALAARAADVEIRDGVRDRYTVERGDTLWGIAESS
jgi:nucleoid-associated protein YgaU